ncbi:M15 family metallopeptidase [Actinotalea solisilvae]|uniref:M15 family metallopeptidase n=1 Tax=Actinotalea solisilvae TaxID=2072922 RepID=UPI0018F24298|nr:M15 family metallopeptidase [Actinotalea solisilvae]
MEAGRSGSSHPSTTPEQAVPASTAPVPPASRRSRRARAGASPAVAVLATGAAHRSARTWLPRAGVLGALAVATIAVPLLDHRAEVATVDVEAVTVADPGYPSAYEVLAGDGAAATATSVLAAVRGTERVAAMASRAYDRDPLPGCDGEARPAGQNGLIPESDLCELWVSGQSLRGDAAVALAELNFNFRAAFGRDLCLTDSYRSLADQRRVAALKPGLAASPGTSNHGWGLAIDLCTSENRSTSVMSWLQDNGPTFGWDNPQWARAGGSGAYEPWHWEYVPGTSEMGTNY